MKSPRSYGEWPSDLTAASIATAGVRLSGVKGRQNAVVWWEGRPTEGGRGILVERRDGEVRDLLGPDANVRSRVHEYDGAVWGPPWFSLPVPEMVADEKWLQVVFLSISDLQ